MTSTRFQPFCAKYINFIVYFDGTRINPRNLNQRNTLFFICNIHVCLFWKSNGISFNQVKEDELKPTFKVVDKVISDKHNKSFINYDCKPKKVQSSLTNVVEYDLETFNKIRAVLSGSCFYTLSKISGKYHRDISEKEYQKCVNDCVVFEGTDCINEVLDDVLSFKGEPQKKQK